MNSQKDYEPLGNKILKHSEYFGSEPFRSGSPKWVVLFFLTAKNHTQTRYHQYIQSARMNENLGKEDKYTLSSRKRRIAAFLIDHFVMTFLLVVIVLLVMGTNIMETNNFGKMATKMLLSMLFGFFLYFAKDSVKGVSFGKWTMGIMVRTENNPTQIPSFGRLLIRNLLLIIWPIEFIILAASKSKKRLGDEFAKTIVVRNSNKTKILPIILTLTSVIAVFFFSIFFFISTFMKNSEAYKTAIKEIEQNKEILIEIGEIKGYGFMPTGNISTENGKGEAQLQITVLGKKNDIVVEVYLTKEINNNWKLIALNK